MHARTQVMSLLLLMAGLGACSQTPTQVAAIEHGAAATPASIAAQSVAPTSAADAGLAIAIARESVDRAARQQTLRVQALLREEVQQQRRMRDAAQRGNGDVRCLSGQKMRRVANGWVQAGLC